MPSLPSLSELVSALIALAEPYFRDYGYPLVFASAVMEHSIFFGWLLPGGTLIVLAAFYAQQGALAPTGVAALALAGFVLGDTLDYMLGRFGGRRVITLLERRGLWRPRDEFLHRHLGKLLPLAYLGSLARSAAIIAAAASGMRYRTLLPVSLAANSCLVAAYVVVGYLAGEHLEQVLHLIERLVRSGQLALLAALLLAGAYVAVRLRPALKRWLANPLGHATEEEAAK